MSPKDADRMTNREQSDLGLHCLPSVGLICVYTVCPGLSVRKLSILTLAAFNIQFFLPVLNGGFSCITLQS